MFSFNCPEHAAYPLIRSSQLPAILQLTVVCSSMFSFRCSSRWLWYQRMGLSSSWRRGDGLDWTELCSSICVVLYCIVLFPHINLIHDLTSDSTVGFYSVSQRTMLWSDFMTNYFIACSMIITFIIARKSSQSMTTEILVKSQTNVFLLRKN